MPNPAALMAVAGNTVEQEAKEATSEPASSEPVTEETPTNGGEE